MLFTEDIINIQLNITVNDARSSAAYVLDYNFEQCRLSLWLQFWTESKLWLLHVYQIESFSTDDILIFSYFFSVIFWVLKLITTNVYYLNVYGFLKY